MGIVVSALSQVYKRVYGDYAFVAGSPQRAGRDREVSGGDWFGSHIADSRTAGLQK